MIPRKHLMLIPAVMAASILTVVFLAWKALNPISIKNGFNRNFRDLKITVINQINRDDIEDIIGMEELRIIFKTKKPDELYITTDSLGKGYISTLPFPNNSWTQPVFLTFINKPNVVLFPNNGSLILLSRLKTYNTVIESIPIQAYTRVVPISPSIYVFRALNPQKRSFSFAKLNTTTDSVLFDKLGNTEIDISGVSGDGHLLFDNLTNQIIYVHIYDNQIISMDTNLVVNYKSKTIDTISSSNLKEGVTSGGFQTNTSPTRVTNEFSIIEESKLYVLSKLKADNEDESFQENSSIDVYETKSGKYSYSFLIPHLDGRPVIKFRIYRNRIAAIYRDKVVLYRFQT